MGDKKAESVDWWENTAEGGSRMVGRTGDSSRIVSTSSVWEGEVVGLCPHPGQLGVGVVFTEFVGAKWCGGAVPGERIRPCWRLWIGVIVGFTKCSKHSSVTRHNWLKCINNTPPGLDFQFQISLLKKYFWFIWNESLSFYQPQSKFARFENVNDETNSRDG